MPLRTAGVKAGLACLMLVWTCRAASGSTTLLRTASKMTPELGPVQTYAGNIDAVISSVKPAPAITIVLLTDSLSPAEMHSIKKISWHSTPHCVDTRYVWRCFAAELSG